MWSRVPRWGRLLAIGVGVVAAVLVVGGLSGYTVSLRSDSGDRATVTSLQEIELQRLRAVVDADLAYLERVYAADYWAVPPTGDRLTRSAFLEALADGSLDFASFEPLSAIDVRLAGGTAVLTYRSHIDAVSASERVQHDSWHTVVYVERDGRWRLLHEQTTALGGFPPPTPS
ncbi:MULTISPECIES: nuclear transport factor 2 family protein [Kribbella]|uniref:Ketosteroid isomerase-like protein n=1 Tax=Kribbella pratensis TaxID=2512112 RepID=A0ABY2F8G7_9ACTN|nr:MULTISPECIES: nuclear transport factor 2 family protein [Kribbella]TDW86885.1 ketosteroid isomerase-like protein [Kribbella pratensis]TDW91792.1 ketosteroid isomerase-like protein [Kribbella sp. VKM Ac-2566]